MVHGVIMGTAIQFCPHNYTRLWRSKEPERQLVREQWFNHSTRGIVHGWQPHVRVQRQRYPDDWWDCHVQSCQLACQWLLDTTLEIGPPCMQPPHSLCCEFVIVLIRISKARASAYMWVLHALLCSLLIWWLHSHSHVVVWVGREVSFYYKRNPLFCNITLQIVYFFLSFCIFF